MDTSNHERRGGGGALTGNIITKSPSGAEDNAIQTVLEEDIHVCDDRLKERRLKGSLDDLRDRTVGGGTLSTGLLMRQTRETKHRGESACERGEGRETCICSSTSRGSGS
jgi:hypothetical protein